MANRHGEFVWYELMTSDPAAAAAFYRAVVGWDDHGFDASMGGYRAFAAGGTDVAGLMETPEEAAQNGARPAWFGYVGVDDVDAAAADIAAAGGVEHMPPGDIPGVGRFAFLADPQGAMFYVMRGASEETSASFSPQKAGHCQWNELSTSDPENAFSFYGGRFGWRKDEAMPMGEHGIYQLFTHHGVLTGAVAPQTQEGAPPSWLFYFGVPDIDVAAKAIADNGGTILQEPVEVPGEDFIVVASDPQGAVFGLAGERGSARA